MQQNGESLIYRVKYGFEWDLTKEVLNFSKHGVKFVLAVETFSDPKGFQIVDTGHSGREKRFYWIGKTKAGQILTTWFTLRGSTVRIIGCAEWRKYRRLYRETAQIK